MPRSEVVLASARCNRRQIEESIQRYLNALETADRTQPAGLEAKTTRLQDKIARLREQMRNLEQVKEQLTTLNRSTSGGEDEGQGHRSVCSRQPHSAGRQGKVTMGAAGRKNSSGRS